MRLDGEAFSRAPIWQNHGIPPKEIRKIKSSRIFFCDSLKVDIQKYNHDQRDFFNKQQQLML